MEKEKKKMVTFLVTIPAELEKKIQKEAQKERRSRHAQVIRALEERYRNTVPANAIALQA